MRAAVDRPLRRWGLSAALVLVVHAVAVGVVLGWASPHAPPLPRTAQAVMMELAPLPAAPPAPPSLQPPGPRQQEQRNARPAPAPRPTPPPPPPQRADGELAQSPPRPKEAPSASEDRLEVEHSSAPPSVQAPVASQYAARQALVGADTHALANWQAQVLGRLERFKRYPGTARLRRQAGVTQVRYRVDRQGRVLDAELEAGSGYDALDREALAAVQRASPLPPPPPEIPGDPVTVVTPVVFSLR